MRLLVKTIVLMGETARAIASKLVLTKTKVKNQPKNQHFWFDLFSKPQSDYFAGYSY
ncbi:MAG: hypothetical protein V7K18_12270 [Nostoc sp.]|uniref:hypothetical protein n=1 Tax=Nostoc sp. TaxID=1180 RepID=UPI002FFCCE2A